ncbi:MAG: hypothetical protein H6707_01450 [Deltaproteobacteria bacterium]|nr:hypothetical protein [Deltaproteobacteria bacterium]
MRTARLMIVIAATLFYASAWANKPVKAWRYADPAQIGKENPLIKQQFDTMMYTLRNNVTPPLFVVPHQTPSIGITGVGAQEGKNTTFTLKGAKPGDKIMMWAFCPTSAHGGLNPDALVKAGQNHSLWVSTKNYADTSCMIVQAAAQNPFDKTATKGPWITTVEFEVEVTKEMADAKKFSLYFDPKPGYTAGVGGFGWGRTVDFLLQ